MKHIGCVMYYRGSIKILGADTEFKHSLRLTPFEWENPHPCVEEPEELENELTLHNCFWHNWGSLMQQGSDFAPK